MNMVCVSTYLYLLFLFSVSYNILSTDLLHSWLGLFQVFYYFCSNCEWHCFLNFPISLLLAYKNATHFWLLILYPATLLNSFVSSSGFLLESLEVSMYSIMSSANNDSFTSSFPVWMPFAFCSCLLALGRTSSTILNKRGGSGHPCLVPGLKVSACSFWLLSMMLAVGLSYMPLLCFGMFHLFPLCWEFLS